jgi:hypothetical protein
MTRTKGIKHSTFWGLTKEQREIKRMKRESLLRVKRLVKEFKQQKNTINGNQSGFDTEFQL